MDETILASTMVDGKSIRVGDTVWFKSDYEQCGEVVKIVKDYFGAIWLTLKNDDGFGGDYLRYATGTIVSPQRCWIEGE